ncbi:peptidase C12 ubiquitin carboxyl-terminal hydrolase 1 [Vararia minispora EC-137]|uniref:Peptidase C12 ubiquitin carboxyl-terminal hydrolase 1 n=1 Tax=Vararia minispora EC-137 TaxID=1314806 RepID=A0ACB8QA16_9AGAM|nr:peptidase C12 ubiquitin carboxyl-terminal hydrolase 1 [Vararia minispora EC-137]
MPSQRWIPLESNPEWAYRVGVLESSAEFVDVYSLDEEMLKFVPEPVLAVVMLFPVGGTLEEVRKTEDAQLAEESAAKVDPTIFWMRQTIGNACGTIGLIHALANCGVAFEPDCLFQRFLDRCKDLSPLERAKALETTDLFASAHAEAAAGGQTIAPDASEDTNLHFTCFVRAPSAAERASRVVADEIEMRLVELDGRRAGPVDRGVCNNLLQDTARHIQENVIPHVKSMNLSLVALVGKRL